MASRRHLHFQQLPLRLQSAGRRIAAQPAARGKHAMAGHDKREPILGHHAAHRAGRARCAALGRQLAVRARSVPSQSAGTPPSPAARTASDAYSQSARPKNQPARRRQIASDRQRAAAPMRRIVQIVLGDNAARMTRQPMHAQQRFLRLPPRRVPENDALQRIVAPRNRHPLQAGRECCRGDFRQSSLLHRTNHSLPIRAVRSTFRSIVEFIIVNS